MDFDDIAHKERFTIQVGYFESNPDILLISPAMEILLNNIICYTEEFPTLFFYIWHSSFT